MTKETEPLHLMLPSLKQKDLLEIPLKIKLLRIPIILSSMLRDLLEENSQIQLSKKTLHIGLLKFKQELTINQTLLLDTRDK